MASRLVSRPSAPTTNPVHSIDNYDVDDIADDPFADSGDDAAQKNGASDAQSKKRKDASGLGIDEAVSVTKKPRVPRVKLDETRLLSDNGIPKLRRKARDLKFKGKGHEFSDAARLLSFYQLWLDDLFPKAKFTDALSMVEKAGHKSQLRLKRIQWIGEGRPKAAGLDNEDNDDDLFGEPNLPEERDPAIFPARIAPIFQNSLAKNTAMPAGDDPFDDDEDIYGASPKRPTKTAPTPTSLFGGNVETGGEPDEDDLDALMAEEETQRTAPTSLFGGGKTTQTLPIRQDNDDDDDLDALMAEAEAESSRPQPAKPENHRSTARNIVNDDEDDLDAVMAEAEAEGSTAKKPPLPTPSVPNAPDPGPSHDVNEDEEAAMAEMDGLW
ncbi:replication fork protection component Swi3-domain-containing protein [Xylaria arbuscula]|nr:replication fork protection component Swi3-domain-containing protein [Xylaria arbuscula]